MANVYKKLGSTVVVANTSTGLYTVPVGKSAVVSSVAICNKGTTVETFRLAHCNTSTGSVTNADYIYYDVSLSSYDSFIFTGGISMAAGNTLLVRASSANVNFIAWGTEIT